MVCAYEHDLDETMALRGRIKTPEPLLFWLSRSCGLVDRICPQ
jgi:hypothetical protein